MGLGQRAGVRHLLTEDFQDGFGYRTLRLSIHSEKTIA